jgi:ribosomal protein S18 acetylase RimI-like enzyme
MNENLSKMQFKFWPAKPYTPEPDYEGDKPKEQPGIHMVSNEHGFMKWHPHTGEILDVFVGNADRRKGIATSMLKEARKIAKEKGIAYPKHSSKRSNMGDAWIKAQRGRKG